VSYDIRSLGYCIVCILHRSELYDEKLPMAGYAGIRIRRAKKRK
jgi:hypothetical protein